MSNLNLVVLSGRLTRDPELRHTTGGTPVASTGIAVERYNKNDPENPYVGFFDLNIFGNFGELVARKAKKGDKATVEGRLNFSSWETPEGQKRSKVDVVVNQMEGEFLYRPAVEDNAGSAAPNKEALAGTAAADDDIPF